MGGGGAPRYAGEPPSGASLSFSIFFCEVGTSSQLGGLEGRIIFSKKIYYYVLNSTAGA